MDITTFPYCIRVPGRYCIPMDVTFGSDINTITALIWVKCPGVTIDLMGNSIKMTDEYNLVNRSFNLIRSKFDVTVCSGTLGLCSGFSIISKGSVHCNNLQFENYELGAIKAPYCSLTSCKIYNPHLTHTGLAYDYARNLIVTCSRLLSKYPNKLPTNIKASLSEQMALLENSMNFMLESYYNMTYTYPYFNADAQIICLHVLDANKIKMVNSQVNITVTGPYAYRRNVIKRIDQEVMYDIGNKPIEWYSVLVNDPVRNLISSSSSLVIDYDLPYPRVPRDFITCVINQQLTSGYSYEIIGTIPLVALRCSDLKIYGSNIVAPDGLISYNTRYIRCFNNSITSTMTIDNAKSIKICSNTIYKLVIKNPCQVEMEDNIIQIFDMTNINKSMVIKCK